MKTNHRIASKIYEYYCAKCKIKITTYGHGYCECPVCKSGRHIRDYGDYEEPPWAGQDFNYNKI